MPRLVANTGTGDTSPVVSPISSTYHFSACGISRIQSDTVTLVVIERDTSGSTANFTAEMNEGMKRIVAKCRRHPKKAGLVVRAETFDSDLAEVHGFLPIEDVPLDAYDRIGAGGYTKLYQGAVAGIDSAVRYGDQLVQDARTVNAIVFVITDGMHYEGGLPFTESPDGVKRAAARAMTGEHLESIVTVLVGINVTDPTVKRYLEDFARDGGFTHYKDLADIETLVEFSYASISAQSQAVGSGGPSQAIPALTI